jgi:hypothetical protein
VVALGRNTIDRTNEFLEGGFAAEFREALSLCER